ncbi:MAG: protein phosphatase 2C domain-containing protein [Candidatus Phosphoribacter sp.]
MSESGLALSVGTATDVGQVRERNEDASFASGSIFLVADGMGGHAAGDVASSITATTIGELAKRTDLQVDGIVAQVAEANRRIVQAAVRNPRQWGMATTLAGVAVVVVDGSPQWAVFNLGDSRVYRFAEGRLAQITVDHSEVQELLDAGRLTPAQAKVHPLRHTVTRSLGREPLPPVDTWVFPPNPGERLVICSDGLTNELDDADIEAVLAGSADVQEAAEALVRGAVTAGGRDNVTVVVVTLADSADSAASEVAEEPASGDRNR